MGTYQAKDGKCLQVHCASQEFALRLLEMVSAEVDGKEFLASDSRFATQSDRMANRDALDQVLSEAFGTKTRDEWVELCEKWSVPGGPVNNIAEALADPQVRLRDMVVDIEHPVAGRYKTAGNPIKAGSPDTFDPPPTLGQHNEEILGGLLGYSRWAIASLRETLVI